MNKNFLILTIITIILLAGNVFLAIEYFSLQERLGQSLSYVGAKEKIKFFNNIFIEKVLLAKGPVLYEDRLKLENAVVDTNDEKIINQWHKLLESQTEEEAQKGVIDLLILFAR